MEILFSRKATLQNFEQEMVSLRQWAKQLMGEYRNTHITKDWREWREFGIELRSACSQQLEFFSFFTLETFQLVFVVGEGCDIDRSQ